jgi:hypothetical protein
MAVAIYQQRNPQSTPLYFLVESLYEKVKAMWEEKFERSCGFWRGFLDGVVARYLDCGVLESGFARVFCRHCNDEFLLPFSCKCRGLCPSCGAKRAAAFAAYLKDELLQDVAHSQWVFTIPKMLRLYFLYHRELLGELCRAAYDTVKELMAVAVQDSEIRPGMVAVIQTFADSLKFSPHIHALVARGCWTADGRWIPVPYVNPHTAELLFRHKIFKILKKHGLLSDERIELLMSWKHTGFSVDNSVTVYPSDTAGLERLARYMLRSPVSLQRLHYLPETQQVLYQAKKGHGREPSEIIDPMEFVARVLMHVPDSNKNSVHYFGVYCNRTKQKPNKDSTSSTAPPNEQSPSISNSTLRRRWANLIRRVYRTDPLICPKCGSEMKIISFITQSRVINKILTHLKKRATETRGPPPPKLQQASSP